MPHGDYVTVSAQGVSAKNLYLSGPVVLELAEVTAPKISDIAPEADRRVGPSLRQFSSFSKGVGTFFADQGDGMWDARNVWSLEDGRVTPRPARILTHEEAAVNYEFNGLLASRPILLTFNPGDSTDYIFVVAGGNIYTISAAGTVVNRTAVAFAYVGRTILEYSEPGVTTNRRMYAFFHRFVTTRPSYQRSTHNDYLTYAPGGRVLCDGIVFDNKLVAADDTGKIVYSTDGLNWNDLAAADGLPVLDFGLRPITFVGVANAPWGAPAIYFLWQQRLFVLNFDTREAFPIPLQNTIPITTGCIWQGRVYITDYFNVFEYDPETQKSRHIGFPGERPGRPFSAMAGTRHLFPVGQYLGAVMNQFSPTTTPYNIMLYNGKGWHSVYADWDISTPLGHGFAAAAVAFSSTGWTALVPQIVTVSSDMLAEAPGDLTLQSWGLPKYGSPVNGSQDSSYLSPSNVFFDSPWFRIYGDLDGVLVQIAAHVDIPTGATGTIRIYYRTSRDNYDTAPANFTLLGEVAAADTPYKMLPFGAADADGLYGGIQWRRMQFRVAFYAAAATNATKWPEFFDLSLAFHKYTTRRRYRFTIDVPETVNQDASGVQNLSEVWQHLQNCINKPLTKIVIPNFYKGMVTFVSVQGVHSDIVRDAQTGGAKEIVAPGKIAVTVEEVAPRDADGFALAQTPT